MFFVHFEGLSKLASNKSRLVGFLQTDGSILLRFFPKTFGLNAPNGEGKDVRIVFSRCRRKRFSNLFFRQKRRIALSIILRKTMLKINKFCLFRSIE